MTPEARLQPGLLEIPDSLLPEHMRGQNEGKTTIGLVTEVITNLMTGDQIARIDFETPAQAAEKILREANDG